MKFKKVRILTIYLKKNFEHNLSGLCPKCKAIFSAKTRAYGGINRLVSRRESICKIWSFLWRGSNYKDRYGIEYKDERAEGKYKPAFINEDISFQQIFF